MSVSKSFLVFVLIRSSPIIIRLNDPSDLCEQHLSRHFFLICRRL